MILLANTIGVQNEISPLNVRYPGHLPYNKSDTVKRFYKFRKITRRHYETRSNTSDRKRNLLSHYVMQRGNKHFFLLFGRCLCDVNARSRFQLQI